MPTMMPGSWPRTLGLGLLAPLALLALLALPVFLGALSAEFAIVVCVVPLLSAAWAQPLSVAFVSLLTWSAAYVLTAAEPEQALSSLVMLTVTAACLLAVALSALRLRRLVRLAHERQADVLALALLEKVETDPLTGLLNARGFLRTVTGRLAPISTVAVLASDCDEPDLAEEATRAVGWRLRAALPPEDILARWQDSEYVMMCDLDYATGSQVVSSVHEAITAEPLITSRGPLAARVPAGASAWADEPVEEAIVRARLRMASSRRLGYRPVLDGDLGQAS